MKVQYYQKEVYGSPMLYIVPSANKQVIERLTGKKTIDKDDMMDLEFLGVEFEQVLPPDAPELRDRLDNN